MQIGQKTPSMSLPILKVEYNLLTFLEDSWGLIRGGGVKKYLTVQLVKI